MNITPANSKTAKFTTPRCTEPCTRSFDEIFFSDWSCLIKLSPETDCVFLIYFFFTKGRNYTYISITLDVHFSWYTFPMSSHNELKFFLKDCLNYWNIQQINCISKMQIEGKSLKNAGRVVPCSYTTPSLAIFTATLIWVGSQKTRVKPFFPHLHYFSPPVTLENSVTGGNKKKIA